MTLRPWDTRLARAEHHLTTLRREVGDYLGSGAVDVEATTLPSSRRVELRFRQRSLPPAWWGAAIGDYVHNLRAALDNLTWAVVQRHKTVATLTDAQERAVQFPIQSRAEGWDDIARRRFPTVVDLDVLPALRREQPFAFTEGIEGISDRVNESHPLSRLRETSNADKHRTIKVVFAMPGMVTLGAPDDRVNFQRGDPLPWSDGSLVGSWLLPEDYADGVVAPWHDLVVAFADRAEPFNAANFTDSLATLGAGAAQAVWRLAPLA